MDAEVFRRRWAEEQATYQTLANHVADVAMTSLTPIIGSVQVTCRVKSLSSMLKKALRKGYTDPYSEITDKAGVRVVVMLKGDLAPAQAALTEAFEVIAIDDKVARLGPNAIGYTSIHFDVRVRPASPYFDSLQGLQCEVQLRTLCQHIWSEMAHGLAYKSDLNPPEDIMRRLNCLAALLEVADREFELIRSDIRSLPGAIGAQVLPTLEAEFFQLTRSDFDAQLSLEVIEHLEPVWHDVELRVFIDRLNEFFNSRHQDLAHVLTEYNGETDGYLFFSQPEGLLLLYLLQERKMALLNRWVERYPVDELEHLANVWGSAYSN